MRGKGLTICERTRVLLLILAITYGILLGLWLLPIGRQYSWEATLFGAGVSTLLAALFYGCTHVGRTLRQRRRDVR